MKAEIIAVGTELLLGEIVNTNASYLAQQLADIGVDVYFQSVVGDNRTRLADVIELAESRADLILLTGGLGPTQDDLTKEVVADHVGRKLVIEPHAMERIQRFFDERGIVMVESNRKQAELIEGGHALLNPTGLALGTAFSSDRGKHYLLLPGPPRELQPMFEQYGLPWVRSLLPATTKLHTRVLRFFGIGESTLEHELLDLISSQQDPTIATYAKEGEVTLRLATKSADETIAQRTLDEATAVIRDRVGAYLYGESDESLESVTVSVLKGRGHTISFAESCTGGMLGEMITSVPGASQVFAGSAVVYSAQAKQQVLGVPAEVIRSHGTVSEETAAAMAEACLQRFGTTMAVSVTGVAGPEAIEGKAVGTIYIAVAVAGTKTQIHALKWGGHREGIRLRAAKQALYLTWKQAQR
jgi:nicotinamide-nucleotide amidase